MVAIPVGPRPYTVYRSRRRRARAVAAVAAGIVLAALVWQALATPRVEAADPGPAGFLTSSDGVLTVRVNALGSLHRLAVTLDGRDVTASLRREGDRLSLPLSGLAEGVHRVTLSGSGGSLWRRRLEREWTFTVDTTPPSLTLTGQRGGRINTSPATFTGVTEAFARVRVSGPLGAATGTADARGAFAVSLRLPDGETSVTVAVTDRAGLRTTRTLAVYVDAVPPRLTVPDVPARLRQPRLRLVLGASDQLAPPHLLALLDGERLEVRGPAAQASLVSGRLAEGRHTLLVTARDRGGNLVSERRTFVVDSSERFGAAELWPGARGRDVRALQRLLAQRDDYSGPPTGRYDEATADAVRRLQASLGLTTTGKVDEHLLTVLTGRIVVDLSDLRLYLYRGDTLVRSYPVATGQPSYPTPTGTFVVTSMQKNPTWYPPNSDWAKDAEPIPPGIDNPLGTRWIGTSAPGVGIHGTPDDASIGTYASHGCIRMHIADVEDLYERVVVGMTVVIRP